MHNRPVVSLVAFVAISDKIFDGKTLTNWEVVGGGKWTVERGGILRGECKKSDEQGILLFKDSVTDFKAKLEFRISSGNSGFYFRAERVDGQPLVKGCQAEIDAIEDVAGIWETAGRGWIFKPDAALHAKTKFVPGKWAKMEVSAIGSHYVVKLNGVTVTDIDDTVARKSGRVALQLHGGMDMVVEFRNIHLAPVLAR